MSILSYAFGSGLAVRRLIAFGAPLPRPSQRGGRQGEARQGHRVACGKAPCVARAVRVAPARPSFGQLRPARRRRSLDLKSSAALVIDQDTNEVLFSKNPQAVLPIASITKLMTALVVADAEQPMDELLTITPEDIDTEKGSRSRLQVGTTADARRNAAPGADVQREPRSQFARSPLPGRPAGVGRGDESQGAVAGHEGHALCRADRVVEPQPVQCHTTWRCWCGRPTSTTMLRRLSTSPETRWRWAGALFTSATPTAWCATASGTIGLQKTGYISEAGRCVVMQAQLAGRKLDHGAARFGRASSRASAMPSAFAAGSDARPVARAARRPRWLRR